MRASFVRTLSAAISTAASDWLRFSSARLRPRLAKTSACSNCTWPCSNLHTPAVGARGKVLIAGVRKPAHQPTYAAQQLGLLRSDAGIVNHICPFRNVRLDPRLELIRWHRQRLKAYLPHLLLDVRRRNRSRNFAV